MLANLDNEVHFKNVFTDVEVFQALVKDVLNVDIRVKKVETEKVLPNKISPIKFRMDLFAEDEERRTVVEIQKVDYDYNYDRFLHYFLANLIDMQKSSRTYEFAKEVFIIVVVTSAYKISDKNGKPIKEDVMLTDLNPRNLKDEVIEMHEHKMIILNTEYVNKDTHPPIKDWMDLIKESRNNPEHPNINTSKKAIARAANLAAINNLSPEELAEAKEEEMRKITVSMIESESIKNEKNTRILKSLRQVVLTIEQIADIFEVSIDYVEKIAKKENL